MFGINCCTPGGLSALVLLFLWVLLLWIWLWKSPPLGTRLPPAVPGASLTGHREMHAADFYCTTAIKWAIEYGPVYRLRQNLTSIVVLNDFNSIKKFYSRNEFLKRSRFWLIQSHKFKGLGTMNGVTWKLNRRFCVNKLRDFGMGKSYAMDDIGEEFQRTCSKIARVQGEAIGFDDYILPCTINNISAILWRHRFPPDHPVRADINNLVNSLLAAIRCSPIFHQYKPGFVTAFLKSVPGTHINIVRSKEDELDLYTYGKVMAHKATAENVTRDFVDAYLKKIRDNEGDSKAVFTGENLHHVAAKSDNMMLFPDISFVETLVGVMTNLLLAGSASTASTIHWLMLKYAMEPDTLQTRVQREIDEVIGRERQPAWEDRLRMPFTMACIWEMDRWKTSTPLGVPREASEDTIVDEFFIPKGTVITANFWAAHYDPKFWNSPEKFDPTRFLNEDGTLMARKPEFLIPFSYGKRSCPGEALASVEVFLGVTSLLQRFRVLPVGEVPFDINCPSIIASHVQHLKLRFIDRDQNL